ncbi:MAG: NADH:ubiquinone oxidoreductase subunit NDUFA12 [Alphaproteobacteria bacterium]|nr:NADH:ubiquinone oxidoreductase subunit NDUFA12 [Alphaproteobacteria bacterium]
MSLLKFLGVLSPVYMNVYGLLSGGEKVGEDAYGNTYFRAKPRPGYKRERRWVMYKNEPEASNVPPEWHGWLHHQTDAVPSEDEESFRRPWQKPHKPNMTGTNQAYRPPGHVLEGGKRDKAYGDYKAWTPPE